MGSRGGGGVAKRAGSVAGGGKGNTPILFSHARSFAKGDGQRRYSLWRSRVLAGSLWAIRHADPPVVSVPSRTPLPRRLTPAFLTSKGTPFFVYPQNSYFPQKLKPPTPAADTPQPPPEEGVLGVWVQPQELGTPPVPKLTTRLLRTAPAPNSTPNPKPAPPPPFAEGSVAWTIPWGGGPGFKPTSAMRYASALLPPKPHLCAD